MRLIDGISMYVSQKRSAGFIYAKGEARLLMFSRRLGDIDLKQITTQHLTEYLSLFSIQSSESVAKYLQLSRFLQYWNLRGAMNTIALPAKPTRVRQTFVPYIFTSAEIRKLLAFTARTQKRATCLIDASTFRMFLLLIYATGSTSAELLALRRIDVNLETRRISIKGGRCRKARTIPIGDDLRRALGEYTYGRFPNARSTSLMFSDKRGCQIEPALTTYNFRRLCRSAGISRRDGLPRPPRLTDLKSTFAVHRITAWIREGCNLNRMLPALAAYMGQAGLGATHNYLRQTPERLKKPLTLLSPKSSRTHWRDNAPLINYLDSLSGVVDERQ